MTDPKPVEAQQAEDERKAMKQGMITRQLSPHFTLGEFLHEHSFEGVTPEIVENLTALCLKLEKVRALLGNRPLTITSGFRSMKHHLEIYAAKGITDKSEIPMGSYHLKGLAADFMVQGVASEVARRVIDEHWNGGMELGTPHVHLDLGPRRRFHP